MFQDPEDIRAAILDVLGELRRPATVPELSAGVWFANSVDGTRQQVHDAVVVECLKMVNDSTLELTGKQHNGWDYIRPELLTRMALIR